jgi:hypothetical protein
MDVIQISLSNIIITNDIKEIIGLPIDPFSGKLLPLCKTRLKSIKDMKKIDPITVDLEISYPYITKSKLAAIGKTILENKELDIESPVGIPIMKYSIINGRHRVALKLLENAKEIDAVINKTTTNKYYTKLDAIVEYNKRM